MPPADRVQIQQVLVNLVWNALESMDSIDSGEHLSIASNIDENGRVCVTVSDTGKGIESENADQIFDSFFTTKADGIGMGLAISRTIIEAHAGRLTACNREDGGAVFQFTLPL
jgi:C4-dicarboxylate-specific signal transduction histidine kinase